MRFSYAPHIESREDGALLVCTRCGHERDFRPAVQAREYFRALSNFVRKHRSCPTAEQREARAKLRDKVVELRSKRPASVKARRSEGRARQARMLTVEECLLLALGELHAQAMPANPGRLLLADVTRVYNDLAKQNGQPVKTPLRVANTLRLLGLTVTLRRMRVGERWGKCVTTRNNRFRLLMGKGNSEGRKKNARLEASLGERSDGAGRLS